MYELYSEMCITNGTQPLSYKMYKREFKSMNIAIHKPKKDQCKTCTGFNNKIPAEHKKKNMIDIYSRKIKPIVSKKKSNNIQRKTQRLLQQLSIWKQFCILLLQK